MRVRKKQHSGSCIFLNHGLKKKKQWILDISEPWFAIQINGNCQKKRLQRVVEKTSKTCENGTTVKWKFLIVLTEGIRYKPLQNIFSLSGHK